MSELIIIIFFMAQVSAVATQGYHRFFFADETLMVPRFKSDTIFPNPFFKERTK